YGTSTNRQIEFGVRNDSNSSTIILMGRYVGDAGSEVSYTFNFRTYCASARISAESEPLSVRVLGNPSSKTEVTVEVTGATGQSLHFSVINSQGQQFGEHSVPAAGSVERRTLRLGQQTGVYFLEVKTPTDRQIIKVLRQ
ncbi:MAG: T9SS type A sorting domain-containing protein, partial [Sphingobacteriales bacterium]